MGIDYDKYANALQNEQVRIEFDKICEMVASRCIILSVDRLDYDGTLTPFRTRPIEARPGSEMVELLKRLAGDERLCGYHQRPRQKVARPVAGQTPLNAHR